MPEGNRKFYMWFAVISITLIIGAIWIALVKYNINTSIISAEAEKSKGADQFFGLQEKLKQQFEGMKEIFERPATTSTEEFPTSTIRAATSTNSQEH